MLRNIQSGSNDKNIFIHTRTTSIGVEATALPILAIKLDLEVNYLTYLFAQNVITLGA